MTPQELLNANHIFLNSYAPGERSTTCPECSRDRKKRTLECLSVKNDAKGACWHCHHCGWSGPEPGSGNGQDGEFAATYDYPGFQKVRYPKGHEPRFRIRHRENGVWKWGAGGADTNVLYRKDEVDEQIELGRTILAVEGEKDVDRLWLIGIPATCNAHGASEPGKKPKWTIEHSKQLGGADLVVLGDHDAAGYEHQEVTCKTSLNVAKRVRRLVLHEYWPQCPKGGDVSDWLDAGHTREELDALIAKAPDYGPQVPPLPFRRHGEKDPLDDRTWAVDGLIPEVGTGVISGQWGTLKTFVALELADCMMTSRPFIKFDITRPGGVLMFALEGQNEVAIRIQGVLDHKGQRLNPAPFYWCEACPALTDPKTADVLIATAKAVAAEFKERFNLPLVLILIDSLIAGAGYTKEGQDNDAALAHAVKMMADKVSRAIGCFVFVIDHYGKDTAVGTRGSSVKEVDADLIFACLGDRSDGGQVSNSRLALRKRRSGPNGEDIAFQGKAVEMGLNPKTGKMETTLVIDWGDDGQQPTAKPKWNEWGRSNAVKLLRRTIMELLVDCGEQVRPFADGPMVRALKLELVAAEFSKRYVAQGDTEKAKKNAKRMAFNRAMDAAGDKITGREIGGIDYIWLSKPGPGEAGGGAGPKPTEEGESGPA